MSAFLPIIDPLEAALNTDTPVMFGVCMCVCEFFFLIDGVQKLAPQNVVALILNVH